MRCPECQYEMGVKNRRSNRGLNGKYYDLTQYHCKYHDIWIELEVPKEDDDEK